MKAVFEDLFKILDVKTIKEARLKLEMFIAEIGIEIRLDKLGMTDKDVRFALDNINLQRLTNNPRLVSKDIVLDL